MNGIIPTLGYCEWQERCEKGVFEGHTSLYPLFRWVPPPTLTQVICRDKKQNWLNLSILSSTYWFETVICFFCFVFCFFSIGQFWPCFAFLFKIKINCTTNTPTWWHWLQILIKMYCVRHTHLVVPQQASLVIRHCKE